MSISVRATHVLSVMLIVLFASNAAGWTVQSRRAGHCMQHTSTCTPGASLTCCCPTAPAPVDRASTPPLARSLAHVSPAALVDCDYRIALVSSYSPRPAQPHGLRDVPLPLLHRTLLI